MKCKDAKQNLMAYLYGECSKECTDEIKKHIASCPRCKHELEDFNEIRELCTQWSDVPIDKKLMYNTFLKTKPEILTLEELATYLRVTPEEILDNLHNIPHIKIGKSIRFRRETITKWLRSIEYDPQKYEKESFARIHLPETELVIC